MNVIIGCEVLTYDELSEDMKQKALIQEHNTLVEIWRADHLVDDFKEQLEKIGFMEPEVLYSGFGSQGDGACFDAKVDLKKVCRHLGIPYRSRNNWECSIEVVNNRYVHAMTRSVVFHGNKASVGMKIETLRAELCEEFYETLQSDYDEQTSEEACLGFLRERKFVYRRGLEETLEEATKSEGVQII